MKNTLFSSEEPKKATKKWLFFPISFLAHGLVIAAVFIAPLMNAESNLPKLKIEKYHVIAPPPVPPPPAAPAKKRTTTRRQKPREEQEQRPRPVPSTTLIAPIEIPTEVEEEDVLDFGDGEGSDFGVEGGVEGGVVGGVVGGVIGTPTDPSNQTELRLTHIQTPKLIRRVEPQYPPMALRARVQGVVIVEAVTDIYGRVMKTHILNGHALLRSAAVQAVRQWVYEPYIVSGIPKPVRFTVTVTFSLTNG